MNKLLVGSILALVLVNIASLGGLWYVLSQRQQYPPPPMHNEGQFEDRFGMELGLSEPQLQQFRELENKHHRNTDSINVELYQVRSKILAELKQAVPDTNKLTAYTEQIGILQIKFERKVLSHFLQVKAMLKPEQFDRFCSILNQMVLSMHNGMPPNSRMPNFPQHGQSPGAPPPDPTR